MPNKVCVPCQTQTCLPSRPVTLNGVPDNRLDFSLSPLPSIESAQSTSEPQPSDQILAQIEADMNMEPNIGDTLQSSKSGAKKGNKKVLNN